MIQKHLISLITLLICFNGTAVCWKRAMSNLVRMNLRNTYEDLYGKKDTIHSIYKFGHCQAENIVQKFLRKRIRMKIFQADKPRHFIYLLTQTNTVTTKLQCVVMTVFTKKTDLLRSVQKLPIYYCQGIVHYLMMNTIQRLGMHEFFIQKEFNIAADIRFDFFQPPSLP